MPVKFKLIEPDEQIGGIIVIHFILNNKVSDIIQIYRKIAADNKPRKFIFNGRKINGDLTAAEAGITNNTEILVYSQ